jgi:uncharacterized protein YdeI (YjbR/CyaY-like superfamily)
MKQKLFKNRFEWREWLEKNHGSEKELWLIYYKKNCGKESIQYEEAVEEALCYGWIDSKVRRLDDERYMQKYTPRKRKSNWSKSNKKRVEKLIGNGQMTKAGLSVINAAKQDGSWDRLNDIETDGVIPDDLSGALVENPIAMKFFNNLSPSYQKQYLWWLKSAKKLETRQNRLLSIIERCERGVKPGI